MSHEGLLFAVNGMKIEAQLIDARPDAEDGVYLITTAAWPKGDRFTRDREWLYRQMRDQYSARLYNAVPVPFVKLDTSA